MPSPFQKSGNHSGVVPRETDDDVTCSQQTDRINPSE